MDIIHIIIYVVIIWSAWHVIEILIKNKKNKIESEREERHKILERLHDKREEVLRIRQLRENTDRWRADRGLRPVYGPHGILAEMRIESDGSRTTIGPFGEQNNPSEGELKIFKGRQFKFDGKRWEYIMDVHEKIEFLTEDDVVIE